MVLVRRKIEGIPMVLDREDRSVGQRLYVKGGREFAFMWLLRQQKGGLALDVGANIGYCTLSLAKNFDKVLSFEPDRRSCKWLIRNVRLNKLNKKVNIIRDAVSDYDGEKTLFIQKCSNLTSFELTEEGDPQPVKTVSIDSLNISPDLIKMDVEGHEVSVIKGAMDTLKRCKCKILMEVHPQYYNKNNDMLTVMNLLYDIGYRITYAINAKDKIEWFTKRGYKPFKIFKKYKKRALFKIDDKSNDLIPFICECKNVEEKVVRSIMMEKICK